MRKSFLTAIFFVLSVIEVLSIPNNDTAFAETSIVLHTPTGNIFGTLTTPKTFGKIPVALIIAGSGPTDRDGNNSMMKNESLRMLAYSLANNNVASVRFDKRGIGESNGAAKTEADLRFEDYITDAKGWVELLKKNEHFSKVMIIGHSEGSLIGMIAALHSADGYVSIAGPGRSADKILKEQLASQPQMVKDLAFPIIDSLTLGKQSKTYIRGFIHCSDPAYSLI
jgi:alpha/beta superfamily hydrolase